MLILPGPPALSGFRQRKLSEHVGNVAPGAAVLASQFLHFVDAAGALTGAADAVLRSLLRYGDGAAGHASLQDMPAADASAGTELVVAVPRPGTISPWSSKATDIAQHCGLADVRRIERGCAYILQLPSALDPAQRRAARACLYDRMTEALLPSPEDADVLFAAAEPRQLVSVDIQAGGEAALQEANASLGLALAADEVRYLVDSFRRLGRNPSDVELMMFAQANSE
ncbi:MAG: phosphoribosylformylglycinamidine synthase, partial [Chromatocurvus sp.]